MRIQGPDRRREAPWRGSGALRSGAGYRWTGSETGILMGLQDGADNPLATAARQLITVIFMALLKSGMVLK